MYWYIFILFLHQFQKSVDELYRFRDHYFEIYPIEEAVAKTANLKQKLKETLEHIEQIEGTHLFYFL